MAMVLYTRVESGGAMIQLRGKFFAVICAGFAAAIVIKIRLLEKWLPDLHL